MSSHVTVAARAIQDINDLLVACLLGSSAASNGNELVDAVFQTVDSISDAQRRDFIWEPDGLFASDEYQIYCRKVAGFPRLLVFYSYKTTGIRILRVVCPVLWQEEYSQFLPNELVERLTVRENRT